MMRQMLLAVLVALATAALGLSDSTRLATAQQAGVANVAPAPPPGGLTQVLAGTTDIQALIDAQAFAVESIWKLDTATQQFLSYVVGAPAFVNTLSSLDPADIVTIKAAPAPFAMTYLGAKPDLAPLGSDLISHVFLVEGFDLWSVPRDEITEAFKRPLNAEWTLKDAHPDWLILYMEPSAAAGAYDVALVLPDGRRAEATFEHLGAASGPTTEALSLTFVEQLPARPHPSSFLPELTPYVFMLAGFNLDSVNDEELAAMLEWPGGGWGRSGQRLKIFLRTTVLSGEYAVAFTAPDGTRVSTTFEHVQSEKINRAVCEPWPAEIATVLEVLPVVDDLCLRTSPESTPFTEAFGLGPGGTGAYSPSQQTVVVITADVSQSLNVIAHEICHAHQQRTVVDAGMYLADSPHARAKTFWPQTAEGASFVEATGWQLDGSTWTMQEEPGWSGYPDPAEDFAEVCGAWYDPDGSGRRDRLQSNAPIRYAWAQQWLPARP